MGRAPQIQVRPMYYYPIFPKQEKNQSPQEIIWGKSKEIEKNEKTNQKTIIDVDLQQVDPIDKFFAF